mmetsp:Transcript_8409/g.20981  ORF Transcript_8409/g.20981 Transcript_8409/m.20981 type:complete len:367 (-) Transcript_8409:374-1474(-)|eukprot:CAMPEP_0202862446 /NCGR_PEP_ID=MMETSP1391-20130828/3484_1 /ASSEMBLY_ACC=CAM_ASM_000867 /TAXON_ID=1034604 /ORGANISM="Chlamydomonas leiostraca, Strain SAG 11-49" /LENGTH=366 /DNA_ID=CAMNT_0049541985 /DNA_START=98 /DNA_END=1198 /DNA_ORIENTATION=+
MRLTTTQPRLSTVSSHADQHDVPYNIANIDKKAHQHPRLLTTPAPRQHLLPSAGAPGSTAPPPIKCPRTAPPCASQRTGWRLAAAAARPARRAARGGVRGEPGPLGARPQPYEVVRNGQRRGHKEAQAVHAVLLQLRHAGVPQVVVQAHRGAQLRAVVPLHVLHLPRVDHDFVRARLGHAAQHELARPVPADGPRLRPHDLHLLHRHARLLAHLAPHRLLDGLALVDEARQARVHAGRELAAAPQQRAPPVWRLHQHDHHGVGARVQLVLSHHTLAAHAHLNRRSVRAAPVAEAVRLVPLAEAHCLAGYGARVSRQRGHEAAQVLHDHAQRAPLLQEPEERCLAGPADVQRKRPALCRVLAEKVEG